MKNRGGKKVDAVAQREEALAKANEIRRQRTALKAAIAAGEESLISLVRETPDYCETATVLTVCQWPKFYGRTKAVALLRRAGLSATRKLGTLTERERGILAEQIRLTGIK